MPDIIQEFPSPLIPMKSLLGPGGHSAQPFPEEGTLGEEQSGVVFSRDRVRTKAPGAICQGVGAQCSGLCGLSPSEHLHDLVTSQGQ